MCKAKQNHRRSTKVVQEIEGERREEKHTIVACRREGGLVDTRERRERGDEGKTVVRFLGFRLTCSHAPFCVPKSVPHDIILDILIMVHSHLMLSQC
jgi:hypothetical protein